MQPSALTRSRNSRPGPEGVRHVKPNHRAACKTLHGTRGIFNFVDVLKKQFLFGVILIFHPAERTVYVMLSNCGKMFYLTGSSSLKLRGKLRGIVGRFQADD